MLTSIRNFLKAPVFDSEEETRTAYLLNTLSLLILVILLVGAILTPILSLFLGDGLAAIQVINTFLSRASFVVLLILVTLVLIRVGYVRQASVLFVFASWLIVAINMVRNGGVQEITYMNFLLPIILAGLFIGIRAAGVYAFLSFLVGGGALYLDSQNRLPAYTPLNPIGYFVIGGISFALTALIISLYIRRLQETFILLQTANQKLEESGKNLEKRVAERTRALASSAEISRRLSTILDPERLMLEVVEQIKEAYAYYHGQIYLLDDNKKNLVLAGATGEAGRLLMESRHAFPIEQGIVGKVVRTKTSILVPDVAQEPAWLANPLLPDTKAEVAVPIKLGNQVIGVLDMQDDMAGDVFEEDLELLEAIANQVAIALQNATQYNETQALFHVSQALAGANTYQEMLSAFMTYGVPQADQGGLLIFNTNDDGTLYAVDYAAAWTRNPEKISPIQAGMRFAPEQIPFTQYLLHNQPLIISDLYATTPGPQTTSPETAAVLAQFGVEAMAGYPLMLGEQLLGAILFGYKHAHTFTERELQPVQAIANQLAILLRNQQLLAETQEALGRLNLVNQRLIGEGWYEFAKVSGGIKVVDIAPGVSPAMFETKKGQNGSQIIPHELAVPINVRGAEVGLFRLQHFDDTPFLEQDQILLQEVAYEVGAALENMRLLEETQQNALALEESRNLLDAVIENLPLLLFVKDAKELRYLRWNKVGETMLGLTASDVLGKNAYDSFSKEDADHFTAQDLEILSGENLLEVVEETVTTSTGMRILHTRKTPVYGSDGQPRYLVGLSEDITERKEAERVLEALSAQNQLVLNSAGEGIFGLDEKGNHTFVNPAAAQILGYTIEELVGHPSHASWHHSRPDHTPYPEEECPIYETLVTGNIIRGEEYFWTKAHQGIPVEFTSTPIKEGGKITGAVVTFRDISIRKQDEMILNQRLAELESLNAIGQILATQTDLEDMLFHIGQTMLQTFHASGGYIVLYDERSEMLTVPFSSCLGEQLETASRLLGKDNISSVIRTREPLLITSRSNLQGVPPFIPEEAQAQSWLATPVMSGNEVIGVLGIYHLEEENYFSVNELRLLATIASNLSTSIQNSRLFNQTQNALIDLENLTRRLTRENWQEYMASTTDELGFVYDLNQVAPIFPETPINGNLALERPLLVQGEVIGRLAVAETEQVDSESQEVLEAISKQLSAHIENLRLLEQTEQSRNQLQANEARLAEALRIARLGHWEYDVEKDLFTFNDQFYSIFHSSTEKVGSNQLSSAQYAQMFVYPDDIPIVGGEIGKALQTTEPVYHANLEHRILYADGGTGYISVQVTVERDESGKITRFYGANQDITERKQAEIILRESEAQLSEALRIAQMGNWEYNLLTDEFTFNDEFYAMMRTTVEHVGSYTLTSRDYATKFVYPDDMPVVGQEIGLAASTADPHYRREITVRVIFGDGQIGYVIVRFQVQQDEQGRVIKLIGANQDISDLKQAEQALAESTHQIELILGTAGEGIFGLDANGSHAFVNPAAAQMLGYEPDELVGKPSHSIWHHSHADGTHYPEEACPINVTLRDGVVHRGEDYFWRKDGSGFPVSFTSRPIVEQGKITGTVVTFQNITQQKQAQETLTRRATELQTVATLSTTASTVLDPAELLQSVVNLTKERFSLYHAHIYLFDEDEQTLDLAYGAGHVGQQLVDQEHHIKLDTEKSLVARAARARKAIIVNDVQADPGFLPNPLLPNTRAEMAIPLVAADKILGVFDVQSDKVNYYTEEDANIFTTLASQIAVALQNARLYVEQAATVQRLRELDHLKSSFLANMSHELRTPLNSIIGFTEIILEGIDGPLTEFMEGDLKIIQKNGKHLLGLINDVLDMAKIEAGRMSLSYERFMLTELLEDVVDITTSLAHDKQLYLHTEYVGTEEIELVADRIRLRQVMINLVGNAVKFTETGGITLRSETKDGKLWVKVVDTGIGVPPEKLETIFEYFSQVDTSTTRKVGGTGLGLPISRRLVKLHQGELWADSSGIEGQGSVFNLVIPLEPAPDNPSEG